MRKILSILLFLCLALSAALSSAQSVEGTWKYSTTTLEAESAANIRKQLNSDTKLEQKLNQCLTKVGFKAGSTIKFDNEGNFQQRVNGKLYDGTYVCSSDMKKMTLRYNGRDEDVNVDINYQVSQLLLTVPGDKFLEFINVSETKVSQETLLYVRSLVTQFQGTKLIIKLAR